MDYPSGLGNTARTESDRSLAAAYGHCVPLGLPGTGNPAGVHRTGGQPESVGHNRCVEFAVPTPEYMADPQPDAALDNVRRNARAVVRGATGAGAVARGHAPIQLVTPEVAGRLAGIPVTEVLRWHSTGTGPRAYRVAGCWVFRASEIEAFIRARGRGSGSRGSERR